jgi:cytochrome c oxidase subunit 2
MRGVITAAVGLLLVGGAAGLAGGQPQVPPAARVEQGRKVFIEVGCNGCHTIGAMGTPIGPDLSKVGFKYPMDYLERWLRNPAAQRPRAHMPKLELTERQVQLLAAFLSTLR